MFLRIKKKILSSSCFDNAGTQYSFVLVENHRESGKVKQKIVKYLASWWTGYIHEYVPNESFPKNEEVIREDREWDEKVKAQRRLRTWQNIYRKLKELTLDEQKQIEIIEKINAVVSYPATGDLQTWIKNLKNVVPINWSN